MKGQAHLQQAWGGGELIAAEPELGGRETELSGEGLRGVQQQRRALSQQLLQRRF